jgi:hypothetical protein
MGAMAGLDSMGRYYRHDQRAGVARGNFFRSVLPSEGSIYDAQSMTALLLFPRARTSIWPDTGALFARKK